MKFYRFAVIEWFVTVWTFVKILLYNGGPEFTLYEFSFPLCEIFVIFG
jgi:hypothetical protein